MVLPRSLTLKVALGLLLAWNLALRLWFAADEPTARRWFDEQYHVANVSRLLETGEHRPDNFFYGAAGLSALSSNHWHYEKTSQVSRLDALIASAGYLFDAEFLGPIPGAAAAAGH